MRAMRAEKFSGYEGLKLVDLPKPAVSDGKVLLRMTAAGVTPLDHTILSGAKHAISSTTNHAKAEQAKALGFDEVIDTSFEKLGDGVRRITGGYGADIVIDGAIPSQRGISLLMSAENCVRRNPQQRLSCRALISLAACASSLLNAGAFSPRCA
jgi:NADPH:quinone reductase-like Zn-dependent oxidoreductase